MDPHPIVFHMYPSPQRRCIERKRKRTQGQGANYIIVQKLHKGIPESTMEGPPYACHTFLKLHLGATRPILHSIAFPVPRRLTL